MADGNEPLEPQRVRQAFRRVEELTAIEAMNVAVTEVSIASKDDIPLPLMPPQVTHLMIKGATLIGPVAFAEGLEHLTLQEVSSEQPLGQWRFPDSLKTLEVNDCHFKRMDLRGSVIETLSLVQCRALLRKIRLPESLHALGFEDCGYRTLPRLPLGLKHLVITRCDKLNNFRRVRNRRITKLSIDRDIPLYENFSELTKLTLDDIQQDEEFPEVSLTHLKRLVFDQCESTRPVEINAPNLEKLALRYSDELQLVGNYAETVKKITLADYPFFPVGDWDTLEELKVVETNAREVLDVPWLPSMRKMTVDLPVQTNGVMVTTLREYKAAWGAIKRKKRAVHA